MYIYVLYIYILCIYIYMCIYYVYIDIDIYMYINMSHKKLVKSPVAELPGLPPVELQVPPG